MIAVLNKKNMKIFITNDPSRRSCNPLGNGKGFGLPQVEHVICLCHDHYLINATKMIKFDEEEKCVDSESYWFSMKGDIKEKLPELLDKALN